MNVNPTKIYLSMEKYRFKSIRGTVMSKDIPKVLGIFKTEMIKLKQEISDTEATISK